MLEKQKKKLASFQILLKNLGENKPLSIQTHYKNRIEAWVTLSEGEIFYGLTARGEEVIRTQEGRDAFFDILSTSSDKEELAQYFNHVKFSPDEAYIVQAGVAHALLGGTVFEPQKNANLTMRAGDWGRNMPNRPLHKDDFLSSCCKTIKNLPLAQCHPGFNLVFVVRLN